MEKFKKVINEDNPKEDIYAVSGITVNELANILKNLSEEGYKNRKVSCCGSLDFYLHLFDNDSDYMTIDTDMYI